MLKIVSGWLYNDECTAPFVRQVPVRNFGARPSGTMISLVVIHCIALPPRHYGGYNVDALFSNALDPNAHPYFKDIAHGEFSSHLFLSRKGVITQYVSFIDRAWHAGRSSYMGRAECNDYSIGIELEGSDDTPYTEEQYQSLEQVLQLLKKCYPAIENNIAGHNEVAPHRKTDPGSCFIWSRIR